MILGGHDGGLRRRRRNKPCERGGRHLSVGLISLADIFSPCDVVSEGVCGKTSQGRGCVKFRICERREKNLDKAGQSRVKRLDKLGKPRRLACFQVVVTVAWIAS